MQQGVTESFGKVNKLNYMYTAQVLHNVVKSKWALYGEPFVQKIKIASVNLNR